MSVKKQKGKVAPWKSSFLVKKNQGKIAPKEKLLFIEFGKFLGISKCW